MENRLRYMSSYSDPREARLNGWLQGLNDFVLVFVFALVLLSVLVAVWMKYAKVIEVEGG